MELRDYLAGKYSDAGADLAMHSLKRTLDRKGYDIVRVGYNSWAVDRPFFLTLRAKDGFINNLDIPRENTLFGDPDRGVYTRRPTMDDLHRFVHNLPPAIPAERAAKDPNTLTAADFKLARGANANVIGSRPAVPGYTEEAREQVRLDQVDALARAMTRLEHDIFMGKDKGQPVTVSGPVGTTPTAEDVAREVVHEIETEDHFCAIDEPAEDPEVVAQRCLSDIVAIARAMLSLLGADAQPTHVGNLAYDLDDRLTTLGVALDDLIDG